jgi:hypothetical protein
MSSSISSSDSARLDPGSPAGPDAARWRRFFLRAVGAAVGVIAVLYSFIALVDPFDTLPLSVPADRGPISTNARFSFPALARSDRFDSAIFGTSTSRLLRPVALDPLFSARFANLAMNDATAYEQASLMRLFIAAHPDAKVFVLGVDVRWCGTGEGDVKLTPRPFPAWMYEQGHWYDRWRGYLEMFNLYAVEQAGAQFGVLSGIKPPPYGRDGYTSFVPPDSEYDHTRVAQHMQGAVPDDPPGERDGPPASWRYPQLDELRGVLAALPKDTVRILFFVPNNRRLLPPESGPVGAVWTECKRRAAALMPGTIVADFMIPSPITLDDDNYWDPRHYRIAVADRLARDLATAARGEDSPDYRLLSALEP